ncbi:hypothetical protein [Christiangramia forsetii]|uniref:Secreted protein n=2 Tax=Christiangramia forsetii TaxID=411153 RepID=A0M4M2_CHRFK|nr:hypothetical protein [Christiangramia forsetii]GGG23117.1 hypothetical protein GCM10011532_02770 [Christiangramia forsetii]CAL67567.1 secreted protein [Christiangramia forsetii KT0803]
MKYLTTTFLILLIIISSSCDRRAQENATNFQSTNQDIEIKSEVDEYIESPEDNSASKDSIMEAENKSQDEVVNSQFQNEQSNADTLEVPEHSGWNWWMVGAISSILMNIILALLLKKTITSKEHYKKRKKHYKNELHRLEIALKEATRNKSPSISKRQPIRRESKENPPVQKAIEKKPTFDDEKPVEVPLSIHSTTRVVESEVSKPVILFAEKASDDKIFSSVTDQKNEHRSVFKLILDDAAAEKAEFEVADSDYILKMAVNSPDTYLYPVCKPENSNQNYSGEIITTKRGVAHKVDGKWKVNEEDKATIKFQ